MQGQHLTRCLSSVCVLTCWTLAAAAAVPALVALSLRVSVRRFVSQQPREWFWQGGLVPARGPTHESALGKGVSACLPCSGESGFRVGLTPGPDPGRAVENPLLRHAEPLKFFTVKDSGGVFKRVLKVSGTMAQVISPTLEVPNLAEGCFGGERRGWQGGLAPAVESLREATAPGPASPSSLLTSPVSGLLRSGQAHPVSC